MFDIYKKIAKINKYPLTVEVLIELSRTLDRFILDRFVGWFFNRLVIIIVHYSLL